MVASLHLINLSNYVERNKVNINFINDVNLSDNKCSNAQRIYKFNMKNSEFFVEINEHEIVYGVKVDRDRIN